MQGCREAGRRRHTLASTQCRPGWGRYTRTRSRTARAARGSSRSGPQRGWGAKGSTVAVEGRSAGGLGVRVRVVLAAGRSGGSDLEGVLESSRVVQYRNIRDRNARHPRTTPQQLRLKRDGCLWHKGGCTLSGRRCSHAGMCGARKEDAPVVHTRACVRRTTHLRGGEGRVPVVQAPRKRVAGRDWNIEGTRS